MDSPLEICPMCGSTFDTGKYKLLACAACSGEGSDACCMFEAHGQDPICIVCADKD